MRNKNRWKLEIPWKYAKPEGNPPRKTKVIYASEIDSIAVLESYLCGEATGHGENDWYPNLKQHPIKEEKAARVCDNCEYKCAYGKRYAKIVLEGRAK